MVFPGQESRSSGPAKATRMILLPRRVAPARKQISPSHPPVTSRCSMPPWYTMFLTGLTGATSVASVSIEFLLTSLVVVLIPGTGVVYTVSSSIGSGRRRGLFAAVGCTLGIVPHMLAAMLGLSGIMQAGSVVFEVVRWAGVARPARREADQTRWGLHAHDPRRVRRLRARERRRPRPPPRTSQQGCTPTPVCS